MLPNGSPAQLLDVMDYVSNSILMPVVAIATCVLIGWAAKPETVIEEMEKSERERCDGEYSLIESLIEMNLRGVTLLPVDLYLSDAEKFLLVDDTHIRPPLSSLPGLGLNAALNLVKIREEGKFISREDMIRRKVGKAVVETLANAGCLNDLPETSQVSLFEFAF